MQEIQKYAVLVAVAAAGTILGGYILYKGKDVQILNDAHQGFDYTG